jgi:glyoxylase-like metal-dependent hydrolase (beta-lactamase superfamily II)
MNQEECRIAMKEGLKKLGVNLTQVDFFITHFHVDHLGLVSSLLTDHSAIYFNRPEAERLQKIGFGTVWAEMTDSARLNGFPENDLQEILRYHPARQYYGLRKDFPFKFMEDGDTLTVGAYQFQCIKTPGHSKSHLCLYEGKKKIFFAGDHILSGITPNISMRSNDENPLKDYMASLDKVGPLDIELVLPGHGNVFENCRERIKELKDHHEKRTTEVASILKKGDQNAYQVASHMTWDIPYDSWDQFPVLQRWFASGETMAHLKYLEEMGRIKKEMREREIIYSLNAN